MDNFCRLLVIMEQLRDPGEGCPWDLKQNFETIAPHTIEEAYEVADAIYRHDYDELKEELGDLLLQVVYHTQLARELNLFGFDDIAKAVCNKLIRRHPHVFGDNEIKDDEQLRVAWEKHKAQERLDKNQGQEAVSAMDGVAVALPALSRAVKFQNRASQVGFDWPDSFEVFFKIEEELDEVREAIEQDESTERVAEEIGDLLFATTNLSRHLKIDPENALQRANKKFEKRFRAIECDLEEKGLKPEDCTLEELDAIWDKVKRVN